MRTVLALCTAAVLLAAPAVVSAQGTPPAATPSTMAPPPMAPAMQKPAAQAPGADKPAEAKGKEKQLTKQQLRMRDCSREAKAKGMKGDPRKQFMKTCLSEG